MSGELWRSYFQLGKETTAGTTVAATRRMYFNVDGSEFTREREPRAHKFATGSRDNVRAFTLGPTVVGGKISMPLSASEIIELLLMGIRGAVTPTGSGAAKLWTFTPGTSLDAGTVEWYDGARGWDVGGVHVDSLKIAGSADGEATVEADAFGLNMEIATPTGSLTERVPEFFEGWETKLYVDTFGGTAGSTQKTGVLVNWDIQINNGLDRKYFAANTINAGGTTIGELEVMAKLTYEASSTESATEFANWDAATKRLVRLTFGDNTNIAVNEIQTLTITGTPTGGDFTITYAGQTTGAIAFNASAATVQTALEALSNIAPGDVTCTGGDLPGAAVVCTFGGTLANTDVALMTTTDSLTGGTAPASAIVQTLAGGNQKTFITVDLPGAWEAVNLSGSDKGTRVYELSLQYVYDTTNAYGLQIRCNNTRSTAY